MKTGVKSKAEQKYAELQRKDMALLSDLEKAAKIRAEKTAKLKQLRLEKEAQERATKAIAPTSKITASKKTKIRKAN
jgi:hypothetical protein